MKDNYDVFDKYRNEELEEKVEYEMRMFASHVESNCQEFCLREIKPLADKVGGEFHFIFNDAKIIEALQEYVLNHQNDNESTEDKLNEEV